MMTKGEVQTLWYQAEKDIYEFANLIQRQERLWIIDHCEGVLDTFADNIKDLERAKIASEITGDRK